MRISPRSVLVLISMASSCLPASAALVLNDLSDYTNDFNYLATVGGTNAWMDNQGNDSTSGSPGWYWQKESVSFTYDAGGAGSPGAFSLGASTSTDRAMGSYTGSGNLNVAWGVVFHNNSGQTISQVDVSFTGEQWARAETTNDMLHFSFVTSATEITDFIPAAGATPPNWNSEANLAFAAPLSPIGNTTGIFRFFDPIDGNNEETVSSTIAVNVPNDHYLVLRWHDGDVADKDAALGIDDLTVSFTATAVPEPSAFLFGAA